MGFRTKPFDYAQGPPNKSKGFILDLRYGSSQPTNYEIKPINLEVKAMAKNNKTEYIIKGKHNKGVQGKQNQGVQGKSNLVEQQIHNISYETEKEELTPKEVVKLLAAIEAEIRESSLDAPVKEKALKRLDAATDEVQEQEPDKQVVAGKLKRMTETLAEAGKTSAAAKKVLDNIKPILVQIGGWLRLGIDYLLGNF